MFRHFDKFSSEFFRSCYFENGGRVIDIHDLEFSCVIGGELEFVSAGAILFRGVRGGIVDGKVISVFPEPFEEHLDNLGVFSVDPF